jgi:hypothetical protein
MFAILPSAGSPCQNPKRRVPRIRNSQHCVTTLCEIRADTRTHSRKFASRTRRARFASCRSAVLETYDFSVSVQRFLPHSQQYG